MRLWIAEKPAVASDIAKALGGNFTRHDGYAESATDIVSYCVGHVLEMVPPETINPAYATVARHPAAEAVPGTASAKSERGKAG